MLTPKREALEQEEPECTTSFHLDSEFLGQFTPFIGVGNLDNSSRVEGLTVRRFSDGQHGFLLLETLVGQQKAGPIVVVARAFHATL